MLQVRVETTIPVLAGDGFDCVAGVVSGVVYECVDEAAFAEDPIRYRLQGGGVCQVTGNEEGRVRSVRKPVGERVAGLFIPIEEAYAGTLGAKSLHDGLPDPAGAAGHHDRAVFEAGVDSVRALIFHVGVLMQFAWGLDGRCGGRTRSASRR